MRTLPKRTGAVFYLVMRKILLIISNLVSSIAKSIVELGLRDSDLRVSSRPPGLANKQIRSQYQTTSDRTD